MGKGRVHPQMSRQFIVGPYMSICWFGTLLKSTGTYYQNTFHVSFALGLEPRTLFSAQFPPQAKILPHQKEEHI